MTIEAAYRATARGDGSAPAHVWYLCPVAATGRSTVGTH